MHTSYVKAVDLVCVHSPWDWFECLIYKAMGLSYIKMLRDFSQFISKIMWIEVTFSCCSLRWIYPMRIVFITLPGSNTYPIKTWSSSSNMLSNKNFEKPTCVTESSYYFWDGAVASRISFYDYEKLRMWLKV